MFCKTPLLPFTPISPYFLWLCTENKTYTTDYDQHVAAVTFAISHTEMHTMLFYDLFIRPIEWMFSLNTTYGQMLREAISSFPKATKFVNFNLRIESLQKIWKTFSNVGPGIVRFVLATRMFTMMAWQMEKIFECYRHLDRRRTVEVNFPNHFLVQLYQKASLF